MKKLIFSVALILSLGLAACGDVEESKVDDSNETPKNETSNKENNEAEKNDETKDKEWAPDVVDITSAQDTSVPFADRLAKIALELYSDTTIDGKERNIRVDSMGDMYYLNMMFDYAITKKATVNLLNRQTIELFKVLQQVNDYDAINLTWQGNTSKGDLTRILAITAKKSEIDAMDFEKLDVSKLKEYVTNYGLHKDLK